MRNIVFVYLCFGMLLCACSSMDIPTIEESNRRIAMLERSLIDAEKALSLYQKRLHMHGDLMFSMSIAAINRIMHALAAQRSDDMIITFLPTRPLLEERKSILGIGYVNRLDIDSGRVVLNLRRFEFLEYRRTGIAAILDLEGQGRVSVSGRYSGVPGSASPSIQLSLRDTVQFDLQITDNGAFVLVPRPRQVMLHSVFRVRLLNWDVPWKEDIPLDIHTLLAPLVLPSVFDASIQFPVPATSWSIKSYEFETLPLRLGSPVFDVRSGRITFGATARIGKLVPDTQL